MYTTLARRVVRHPWWTIGAWLVAAAVVGFFGPGLSASGDQAEFLPSHYESVQAGKAQKAAFAQSGAGSAATFVVQRRDGAALTGADQQLVEQAAGQLRDRAIPHVTEVQAGRQTVSENGLVQLIQVTVDGTQSDPGTQEAGRALRAATEPMFANTDLKAGMTGDVGIVIDAEDAFASAEQVIALATVGLIIVLQLLIFRSPVAALLPMVTIGLLVFVSVKLIGIAQRIFSLTAEQSVTVWVTVVLFGVGTDYILFLLFRYREQLRGGDDPRTALIHATARVAKVITSAGAAIVIAFSTLAFSSFGSFKAQGPALAIAVVATVVTALTLIPAIVSLLGPKVFWPSKSWQRQPRARASTKLSNLVVDRAGVLAAAAVVVLALLSLGALRFQASYDYNAGLPQDTESAIALKDLQRGFPVGALNPSSALLVSDTGQPLEETAVDAFRSRLAGVEGVGQAGPAAYSPDRTVARISVLLDHESGSPEAVDTVADVLRPTAHEAAPAGTHALVGGPTATFADIRSAVNRDYSVVFPLAAALTALVLLALLRSIVAAVLLMVLVGLSYLATLGTSVLVMQEGLGKAGIIFNVPIFMYLFVVAIGTDYNILMVDRLRDETREGHSPREAARLAIRHTGPTAVAAGVILAGTFSSLLLAGVALLAEMGFAVAAGILISALLVSSLLVPALMVLMGRGFWWPARLTAVQRPQPVAVTDPASPPEPVVGGPVAETAVGSGDVGNLR
ncbi:MMPL family transporter [Micromonospora sp. KC721]|uniref:MMPL family transporter n=1 Tax=Micromonospora sp. KC721 TaxID=2530380 RepID=UPI00104AAC5F|nr:MMPL family transporter [Micromonospora sp. KC721]TDB80408.1 MMPL family transporter [Micromonospora sp. KC721]